MALCKRIGNIKFLFWNKWEIQPFDKEQTFLLTTAGLSSKGEVQKNISEAAEEKKTPWILITNAEYSGFLLVVPTLCPKQLCGNKFFLLVCIKCAVLLILLFWKISDRKCLQEVFMSIVCMRVLFSLLQHFRKVGLIEVNGYFNSLSDHLSFAFWFINTTKEDIIKQ